MFINQYRRSRATSSNTSCNRSMLIWWQINEVTYFFQIYIFLYFTYYYLLFAIHIARMRQHDLGYEHSIYTLLLLSNFRNVGITVKIKKENLYITVEHQQCIFLISTTCPNNNIMLFTLL